jgi:NAD(P)-dependent dehydrogenase (short-subunit alcohol dehydrogenase family)
LASESKSKAEEVVRAIRDRGGDAVCVQADVTDAAQVRTLVHRTAAAFGGLDHAFNNGGSGGKARLTAEMDERDWDKTIDGHLKSVWLCMKYEIPEMLKRGGGVIVNNSSVDGLRAYPVPAGAAYSAAKHGVIGLCSERATFVVGAALAIDGGYLA